MLWYHRFFGNLTHSLNETFTNNLGDFSLHSSCSGLTIKQLLIRILPFWPLKRLTLNHYTTFTLCVCMPKFAHKVQYVVIKSLCCLDFLNDSSDYKCLFLWHLLINTEMFYHIVNNDAPILLSLSSLGYFFIIIST